MPRKAPTHQARPPRDARPSAAARGYGARWRKFRAWFLAAYPMCSTPGCPEPATDVDHIDGAGPLGPRGYDPANCQALCHACHSRKTAREDR